MLKNEIDQQLNYLFRIDQKKIVAAFLISIRPNGSEGHFRIYHIPLHRKAASAAAGFAGIRVGKGKTPCI